MIFVVVVVVGRNQGNSPIFLIRLVSFKNNSYSTCAIITQTILSIFFVFVNSCTYRYGNN